MPDTPDLKPDSRLLIGKTAIDEVTGFTGLVTAVATYITGEDQAEMSPRLSDSGEWREPRWFGISRLAVLPDSGSAPIAAFNARHPVGSKIRVWTGPMGEGPGRVTEVTAPGAYLLGGHTPVVKIPGNAIALTHVLPAEG